MLTCCVMMMIHIIPRKSCGIGGFSKKLQIEKWTPTYGVFENAKNGPFFDFKTQKMVLYLYNFFPVMLYPTIFWKFFSDPHFFSKNFKNIWFGNLKNIRFFWSLNYDNKADFGKLSFFVKPKWFHGGFKFINLKPPLTQGGFKWF